MSARGSFSCAADEAAQRKVDAAIVAASCGNRTVVLEYDPYLAAILEEICEDSSEEARGTYWGIDAQGASWRVRLEEE